MKFFLAHTKVELASEGMRRGCPICPLSLPSELVNSPQLKAREFWEQVEQPELGNGILYPSSCLRFSEEGVACQIWRRAPLVGEHNMEIYHEELGLSREEIISLEEAGVI